MSEVLKKHNSRSHSVLYVSNLPYSIAPVQLEEAFHKEAQVEVEGVELLKKGHDGFTKTCGLAVVTLREPADLNSVMQLMDGKVFLGRPMIVRKDKFVEDDNGYEPAH